MDAKKKLDCSKSRKLEVIPSLSLTVNYWLLALMWQKHFLDQSLDHPFTKFLNLPLFSKLFYKLVLKSFFLYSFTFESLKEKKKLNKFGSSDKYRRKRKKHVGSNSVHIWFVEQVMLVFKTNHKALLVISSLHTSCFLGCHATLPSRRWLRDMSKDGCRVGCRL